MKRPVVVLLAVVIYLAIGCSTIRVNYTSYTTDAPPAKLPEEVRVYRTSLPDLSYEEIGMIEVEGAPRDSASDLLMAIRAKAAESGADAIIIHEMGESMRGIAPIGGMLIPIQKKLYRATAIRFKNMSGHGEEK